MTDVDDEVRLDQASIDRLHIAGRLREERERIGIGHRAFAITYGVPADKVAHYEVGALDPDCAYLSKAAEAGYDLHYVLTGERRSVPAAAAPAAGDATDIEFGFLALSGSLSVLTALVSNARAADYDGEHLGWLIDLVREKVDRVHDAVSASTGRVSLAA